MTRQFILLAFLICLVSGIMGQEVYQVLNVKGTIKRKKDGKVLTAGDQINGQDEVIFTTPDAMAAVVSTLKGRFVLKAPGTSKPGPDGFITAFAQQYLTPSQNSLSSRSGALITLIDFQNTFVKNPFLVLGNATQIEVSSGMFRLDHDHDFFVRYTYEGGAINKLLPKSGVRFTLSRDSIYRVDGKPIDPKDVSDMELCFYDHSSERTTVIGKMNITFASDAMIFTGVQTLVKVCKQNHMEREEIITEIGRYLSENFGTPTDENLETWVTKRFEL